MPTVISAILVLSLTACTQTTGGAPTTTTGGNQSSPSSTATRSSSPTVPAASTSAPTTSAPASTAYTIPVFQNEKQVAALTTADLAKLPQISVAVEGTTEQGPKLSAALASVGITDYTSVAIDGFTKGRLATAELVLQKSQVTDDVILALVSRGTVKLTGTSIGAAKALIDVNKITVK